MESMRFSISVSRELTERLDMLARQNNLTRTELITTACQMYCDREALQQPGSLLPQWAVQQLRGICGDLQTQLNNRSNQLLSSIAIQLTVLQMVVSDSLEVTPAAIEAYTAQAVTALKQNNRVFHMEEFVEG